MNQKEKKIKLSIITSFMNLTLENDQYPKSVYKFCQVSEIEEKTFYKFFGSLDGVKTIIWETFYDNAMLLLEKDENFENAKPKEKLLSFYYTFFEVMLLNRSYILFALSGGEKIMTKM